MWTTPKSDRRRGLLSLPVHQIVCLLLQLLVRQETSGQLQRPGECCEFAGRVLDIVPEDGDYCNLMGDDPWDGWKYPDLTLDKDGSRIPSANGRNDYGCCGPKALGKLHKVEVTPGFKYEDKISERGDSVTNRLRFTERTIAQEGLSFCIVGRHLRRSPIMNWEPLYGFRPIAMKSFDIGNHIDPDNPTKMNTFDLPNPQDHRSRDKRNAAWADTNAVPTHEFENVWLGTYYQPTDSGECPGVRPGLDALKTGYIKRPAHPDHQPDSQCKNPYRVSVTMIESDGLLLHNYLHIKVYAEPSIQPGNRNCPTGKIKLLMLEVRDQEGLPVGQFTDDIPCERDPSTQSATLTCPSGVQCKSFYGSRKNVLPCMYSHPKNPVHPTIFMASAVNTPNMDNTTVAAGSGSEDGAQPDSRPPDICRNSSKPKSQRSSPFSKENPNEYFTEIHATWRFAQHNPGWISELHFATMIIEDETPIQYYTSRRVEWYGPSTCATDAYKDNAKKEGPCCWRHTRGNGRCGTMQTVAINSCVDEEYNTNRPYGFSARYLALKPTFKTRGGWDYFRSKYIRPHFVDCHIDISYGPKNYYTLKDGLGVASNVTVRSSLTDYLKDTFTLEDKNTYRLDPSKRYVYELGDWLVPGVSKNKQNLDIPGWSYVSRTFAGALMKLFRSSHQDPITLHSEFDADEYGAPREYFGSEFINIGAHSGPDVIALQEHIEEHDQEFSLEDMVKNDEKVRCSCPYVPTTLSPEFQSKRPVELEGRQIHAVNMLIAWVFLVPISLFVARFFKETYSKVFFLQEFWWYTIHVICLFTALLFTAGGIYGLKVKRDGEDYSILWTDATTFHIYGGYGLIAVFVVHLLLGSFRLYDTNLRMIQIALHWGVGWLEYAVAAAIILSSSAIPSGEVNCMTFGIYSAFLLFQLAFTLGMEVHAHRVDHQLDLDPPRAYLPPPVMRLFHKDAPESKFRIIMLGIYCTMCIFFYAALHISIGSKGSEHGCFEPHSSS